MATESNTIETKVSLDTSQAQLEIVKLNAVASDSTKTLEERVAAKNKQVELQERLNKQEIKSLEAKVKSLKGVAGSEKELEKAEKKLQATRVRSLKQSTSLQKQNNKLNQSLADSKSKMKTLDKATGGMITSFTALAANPIVLMITGLVALFKLLKDALTSSEEGQDKWNKIMTIGNTILGNMLDIVADLVDAMIWLFTHPKKAIEEFGNFIKTNISNRIEGLMELIPKLGDAVTLVFSGKFSEAGKVAVDAMGKVATGVNSVTDSIELAGEALEEFIAEQQREASIASEVADKRAAANKLDTELIKQRANANRDRAELLNKAEDKERFNAEQRAEFLRQASKLEEEITNKEIAAGKLRFEAKALENTLSRSTLEDKQEEARLEAELINLQTAKLTKEKEIITKIIGFNNEARAESAKLAAEKKKEDEEASKRRSAEIDEMRSFREKQDEIEAEAKQRKLDEKIAAEEAERVRLADVAERDRAARDEIHALEVERLQAQGVDTAAMELSFLILKRDQELAIFEGTLEEKKALTKKYDVAIGKLQMQEVKAAKAKEAAVLDAAMNGLGEAFGLSQEVAVARMVMAAPEAVGQSFKMAAEAYPAPLSIAMGALGAAGVVAPIIKGLGQIKKTRFSGSKGRGGSRGGGQSIAMPTGISTSAVSDLAANNAANIAGDTALDNSATSVAANNVNGSSSSSIVFQEGQYNDFQEGINFIDGQTNVD